MAISCAIELQHLLATEYATLFFMTGNMTQDYLESWFGVMRAKGGCNVHPTGLEFLERVGRWLKEKFLKDKLFDIEALKEALPGRPTEIVDHCEEVVDEDTVSLDHQFEDSETHIARHEGIVWIAGNLNLKNRF
jgi:hypothetical protein